MEQKSPSQSQRQAGGEAAGTTAPIVVNKKKKRRSKGLKNIQRIEKGASDATYRMAKSVSDGMKTYRKRRNKSARKRRDGALTDLIPNVARGLGDAMRTASEVPEDLSKMVNTKRFRRRTRRFFRAWFPFR